MLNLKKLFNNQPLEEGVITEGPCSHEWELTAHTYAPPIRNNTQVVNDLTLLEKIMFGVTTCVWKCNTCGEMKSQELIGSDENQLLDILEKVDRAGGQPQYIKENNKVYVIMEYVPPSLMSHT